MRDATWVAWAVMASCAPYQPPCEVQDHRTKLVTGFTPDLQVSGTGEVWATGWSVDDDDDASSQLAGVATFAPDGTLLGEWTLPVPVLPSEVLGARTGLQWAWTGDGIATMRRVTEPLPPDDAGEHVRTFLSFRAVATDGSAGPPVELASCRDCLLRWAMKALEGRVAVVYQQLPLTTDVEAPVLEAPIRTLLLGSDGGILAQGDLPLTPTVDDLGRFEVDSRGLGFWLTMPDGTRLLDPDLQVVAGPYETASTGPTPMDLDGNEVHAAWVDETDNVFQRSFRLGGAPLGPVERISHGTAQALRPGPPGLGVVLRDDGEAFFALSVDDAKVGGDVLLPGIVGGWPAVGALFVDGDADFTLFLGDKDQVDRLEVVCGP